MLKRIKIQGLGPHLDFRAELDPRGPNTVSGPSEAGKTFLVEAVLFALYGRSGSGRFRAEAIHDGASKAIVELTLDSGRTIRRTATKSKQTRAIEVAEEETVYASEDAFAAALGDLGRDPTAIELAMVPMAWVELAAGNARALRDVLARVLPGGDLGAEVRRLAAEAGVEVTSEESVLDEGMVSASRRAARKDRDQAEGRLELAKERLAALSSQGGLPDPTPPPDPAVVAAVDAWDAWDRQAGQAAAREQALLAQTQWDQRRQALGTEPKVPKDTGAAKRADAARASLQQAWQAAQQAGGQLQMVTMQRQMFAAGTDVCPTCQRPGWTTGAAMVATLDQQLAAANAAAQAANAAVAAAQAAVTDAEADATKAREAKLKADAWIKAVQALGPRPEVPPAPEGLEPPAVPRPDPPQVEAVRRARAGDAALAELRGRRARDLAEAEAVVAREQASGAAAERQCERLDVLLDAVRRAPSVVAEQQAKALGDLGPVTLEFGESPAVRVLVDGRPWWLASRGRQVVADAWLRGALRRAMQLPWLVLFVDNVQDVGGQPLPELPGPVVFLQTTEGKGIHVRRKVPREGGTSDS